MNTGKVILVSIIVSALTSATTFALLTRFAGDGVVEEPVQAEAQVPPLRGMSANQARLMLDALGLMLVLDGEVESAEVAEGLIVSQRPLPGSSFKKGWPVKVEISVGKKAVVVPTLVGSALEQANAALDKLGLKAEVTKRQESADVPAEQVMLAMPGAGTEVEPGAAVKLVVSAGAPGVEVPNVIAAKYVHAKGILRKAGFEVGEVKYHSHPEAISSTVLKQKPEAGTTAPAGSAVNLLVNTAE